MKFFLFVIGISIILFAIIKIFLIFFAEKGLTEYDKGNVWGNIVLIIFGLIIIYFGNRRKINN